MSATHFEIAHFTHEAEYKQALMCSYQPEEKNSMKRHFIDIIMPANLTFTDTTNDIAHQNCNVIFTHFSLYIVIDR